MNPGRPHRDVGGKYVPPKNGFSSGVSHTLIGQPPAPVVACTNVMYTRSTSGRSSRSTLIDTKSRLSTLAIVGSSNDSCSIT